MLDIEEKADYIETQLGEAGLALSWYLHLKETILQNLTTFPLKYPLYDVEPWREQGIRLFPARNDVVLYHVEEGKHLVYIRGVCTKGRDLSACRTAKQSSHLLHKNGKLNGQPHENISHSVPKKTARFFLASWKEFLYSDVVAHTNIKKEKERPTTVRSFSCARTSRARDLCPTNMAFVQHRLL